MISPCSISIVIATSSEAQRQKAAALSEKNSIPLSNDFDSEFQYHLVYTDNRLELQQNPLLTKNRFKPVYVDFLHGQKLHERISTTTVKNPIARSVGIKSGYRPSILDTTAGMGVDGFTLAWLGCKVVLAERSPIIFALLEDGISRVQASSFVADSLMSNVTLLQGDSRDILFRSDISPEVIYIDPMFPVTVKGPVNKKEMRMLRDIVGDDLDGDTLLELSLKKALKRVVVKRPKGAPPLYPKILPTHKTIMKSGRFDVYLIDHL